MAVTSPENLTPAQQKELDLAIKESYNEKNWISEEEAN